MMDEWDDREKDDNYRRPKGRLASAMKILFVGSITFFVFYIATYILDWVNFTPQLVDVSI